MRGALVIRHEDAPVFIHERGSEKVQEHDWTVELCPDAIRNRPITNMTDSV
jgi:hypothetical protein